MSLRAAAAALVACSLAAWACSSLSTPTESRPAPETQRTSSTPSTPGPTPTPLLSGPAVPSPSPAPDATPDPSASPAPPQDSGGCGSPLPPELAVINVKIHQRGDNRWILDATPLVGPDPDYCAKIGFTDGRSLCPVRPEGNPEREACELYVTGRAADTGRPGPTWSLNGSLCTGAPGCANHEDNQYLVYAYGSGLYKACGKSGVCGDTTVDR